MLEFRDVEVDMGRPLEESAVCVRRFGVLTVGGPVRVGVVEPIEEASQIVGTGSVRTGDQIVGNLSKAMFRELAEVFGKQAPHTLQDEVAENVGIGRTPTFSRSYRSTR